MPRSRDLLDNVKEHVNKELDNNCKQCLKVQVQVQVQVQVTQKVQVTKTHV